MYSIHTCAYIFLSIPNIGGDIVNKGQYKSEDSSARGNCLSHRTIRNVRPSVHEGLDLRGKENGIGIDIDVG